MINAIKNHEPVFLSKNNIATWVDVDFIADAVDSLLCNTFRGVIHLGTDEKESGYTMNCRIARQLGLDRSLIHPVDDDFIDNSFDLSKQRAQLSSERHVFKIIVPLDPRNGFAVKARSSENWGIESKNL
jgi:dTDP-4-dehydrorhamnose reductase